MVMSWYFCPSKRSKKSQTPGYESHYPTDIPRIPLSLPALSPSASLRTKRGEPVAFLAHDVGCIPV